MRSCLRRPGWFLLAFTLLWAAPAAAQVPATGPWTLTFQSQAGDWVGQGETKTYTDLQLENIFTIGSSTNGGVGSRPRQRVHLLVGLQFQHAGRRSTDDRDVHETARRNPFSSFNGLSFTGSGRGCNTVAGRFVVLEATFGSGGTVLSFAADFEQHCDNDNPALFGAIRYHSSVPIPPSFSSLYKLTMTPPVHGTVTSTGVLNCGGAGTACDETLVSPGDVTLTATPDSGYIFGGMERRLRGRRRHASAGQRSQGVLCAGSSWRRPRIRGR